jgi:hypothetical protein
VNASSCPSAPWSSPPLDKTIVPSAISAFPPAREPVPGARRRAKRMAE